MAVPEVPITFWEKFVPEEPPHSVTSVLVGPCWRWTGRLGTKGYGRFDQYDPETKKTRTYTVHRLAYQIAKGVELPDDVLLDHLCINKPCGNPAHLEEVNLAENTRRWAEQNITTCPKGHPYDEQNTLVNTGPNGEVWRRCRICHREREALRRQEAQLRRVITPRSGVGRPINTKSKLGWLINWSGKPTYYWAAMAGISMTRMKDYISMRKAIPPRHLIALSEAFGVEPEDLVGPSHEGEDAVAHTGRD
jgi:hypothetical protein